METPIGRGEFQSNPTPPVYRIFSKLTVSVAMYPLIMRSIRGGTLGWNIEIYSTLRTNLIGPNWSVSRAYVIKIYIYVYVIARAGVIFGIYFTSCRYSGSLITRGVAECYFAALPKTSGKYPRISRLPVL